MASVAAVGVDSRHNQPGHMVVVSCPVGWEGIVGTGAVVVDNSAVVGSPVVVDNPVAAVFVAAAAVAVVVEGGSWAVP